MAIGVDWYGQYAETHGPFMPLLIGGAVLIASVTAFFACANGATERQHARFTPEDVQSALENCLDLHGDDHDESGTSSWGSPSMTHTWNRFASAVSRSWDPDDVSEPVAGRLREELEKILQELRSRVPQ